MTLRRAIAVGWPGAAILAAALALWAPSLAIDVGRGDSLALNLNWIAQFSDQFTSGALYPRWLPASFEGLGSPAFYFYPPLAFWWSALLQLVAPCASPLLNLKLAGLSFLALSGGAAYAWLRAHVERGRAALGAIIFMAEPYHLDDYFVRGAQAEFLAIALLPLVALGLEHSARGGRWATPLLALAYGALVLAHLPTALLASVLLVAPYALFLASRRPGGRVALIARIGLGLGTGLGAIYLAPALTLQGFISAQYLWSARFKIGGQLFANPHAWTMPFVALLAVAAALEALIAGAVAWRAWREGPGEARWRAAFFGALAVASFWAMSGLLPGFWSLPLLAKVQFPWRAMSVEAFALASALALAAPVTRRQLGVIAAALAIANPGLVPAAAALLGGGERGEASPAAAADSAALALRLDAPEYLPAGMLAIEAGEPRARVPLAEVAARPLADGAGVLAADSSGAEVRVRLAPGPARPLILRRFYFPAWRAACDGRPVAVQAAGPARLAAFTVPAGARACEASLGATAAERVGALASAASAAAILLLALAALAASSLRRRREPAARDLVAETSV